MPWIELDCEDEVRELLKIREKLMPYLYKAFEAYKKTGKPPVRTLVMDYSFDKETYKIDDEYMLGDSMLVVPITELETERKVYLPKGIWIDFWTNKTVKCGWFNIETQNIPVYTKVK